MSKIHESLTLADLQLVYDCIPLRGVTHADIQTVEDTLQSLSKNEVIALARGFGLRTGLQSKTSAIRKIVGRLSQRLGAIERGDAIQAVAVGTSV